MGKFFRCLSAILVFIGALNWGLVGLWGFDIVAWLFGEMSVLSRLIYITIGFCAIISGINLFFFAKENHRM